MKFAVKAIFLISTVMLLFSCLPVGGLETEAEKPELIVFSTNSGTYILYDDFNITKHNKGRNGTIFDGRIYFMSGGRNDQMKRGHDEIYSILPDGSDRRTEYYAELIYSDDVLGRPEFCIVGSNFYVNVSSIFFSIYLRDKGASFPCRLDRETGELEIYEEIPVWRFVLYNDSLYITDDSFCLLYKLDLKTGTAEPIVEGHFAFDPVFVSNGRIYFRMRPSPEEAEAVPVLHSVKHDGSSLRREKYDFFGISHGGWSYHMVPDACSHSTLDGEQSNELTDRMLCRTNLITCETQEFMSMYYCSNYFPLMTFGSNGFVFSKTERNYAGYRYSYWYIPYDGSEPTQLDVK